MLLSISVPITEFSVLQQPPCWYFIAPPTILHAFSYLPAYCVILTRDLSRLLLCLSSRGLGATNSHQLANNQILLAEPFFPPTHGLQLLIVQVLKSIQRSIEILGQHFLVKATARKTSTGVAASEVRIRTAWTVEVTSRCHIKYAATHRQVYWHTILAIVGKELGWGKGSENGRRRSTRQGLRSRRFEAQIDDENEQGEENQVDGRHWRRARSTRSEPYFGGFQRMGLLTHMLPEARLLLCHVSFN